MFLTPFFADNATMKPGFVLFILIFLVTPALHTQGYNTGVYSDTLRGEVWIELEPVYMMYIEEEYPLDIATASKRALEEAAAFYSAMIYGWSFHYDIGERARRIPEEFHLTPVASIPFGDPGLQVTEVEVKDKQLRIWTDYHLTPEQQRRMQVWKQGNKLSLQGVGYGPLGTPIEVYDWVTIKMVALENAARTALRATLRESERNRPKEVTGYISLAAFPRYFFANGRWAATARFSVEITEIIPFAAY